MATKWRTLKTAVTVRDAQGLSRELVPLSEAGQLKFEMLGSVRKIAARKGQGHLPGYYWFSSIDRLVPYESRLEMFTLLQLDFSGEVVGVLSQPLVLHFQQHGRTIRHVPDFLLSDRLGGMTLVDVKPSEQVDREVNRKLFRWTEDACSRLGWGYEVRSEPDETFLANLQWLAGYRRPPGQLDSFAGALVSTCSRGNQKLGGLVGSVGDLVLVRPVLFHLLWRRILSTDMTALLSDDSGVWLTARA